MRCIKTVPLRAALIAVLMISLSSLEAVAQQTPEKRNTVYLKNKVQYVLTFKESSKWKLQVFEAKGDNFEDLILAEEFQTEQQAFTRHAEYLSSIGYVEPQVDDQADLFVGVLEPASADDTGEYIWKPVNSWTADWELAFSNWVEHEVDPEFFKDYGIATDCADVIIGLRWIFARTYSLPAANTLAASGRLFGHMTVRPEWRSLATAKEWYRDQKFLAALEYVMKGTYTRSLSNDSYPIAINESSLIPGSHHLEFHSEGGHAMMVKSVQISNSAANTKIVTMDSTLPVKVRVLATRHYIYGAQASYGTGFLRVSWPVKDGGRWSLADANVHPGYSTEQYDAAFMQGFGTFSDAVKGHLSGDSSINVEDWRRTLHQVKVQISDRANSVYDGYHTCLTIDCAPGSVGWDKWSTPSRDGRLKALIDGVYRTVQIHQNNSRVIEVWNDFLKGRFMFDQKRFLTYGDAVSLFLNDRFNSDPRQSIDVRWGL